MILLKQQGMSLMLLNLLDEDESTDWNPENLGLTSAPVHTRIRGIAVLP